MKFWYERRLSAIKRYEKYIKEAKEDIENPTKLTMAGITWEIASDLEKEDGFILECSHDEVSLYIHKPVSPEHFEDVFDFIEDVFNDYNYFIDPDFSSAYGSTTIYRFQHETMPVIDVRIQSGVCRTVNTGKMIPETKTECSFIQ